MNLHVVVSQGDHFLCLIPRRVTAWMAKAKSGKTAIRENYIHYESQNMSSDFCLCQV